MGAALQEPSFADNEDSDVARATRVASATLVALRPNPLSVAAAAAAACLSTAIGLRKWRLSLAYLSLMVLLSLIPSLAWRSVVGVAGVAFAELVLARGVKTAQPQEEQQPPGPEPGTIDAVATKRWDIPPPPTATLASTSIGVKARRTEAIGEVSSELQTRWKSSTLDPSVPPPRPAPSIDKIEREEPPVVISTNHLLAKPSDDDFLGSWQLDSSEIVLDRDGRAHAAQTLSSQTTWRVLDHDQIRIEMNCPRLTPTGNFGGTAPAVIEGKVVDDGILYGEFWFKLLGVNFRRNVTMVKTTSVTPST